MTTEIKDLTPVDPRYAFQLDERSGRLFGIVNPHAVQAPDPDGLGSTQPLSPPTLHGLKTHLRELGYDTFFFPTNSLQQFLRKLQQADQGKYVLGEKRDAKLKITVAHDKLTARAQMEPAWGGSPLTREMIAAELRRAHVAEQTLNAEKIDALCSAAGAADLIIANAIPPINGTNAKLEPLVNTQIAVEHDADAEEAIDQHEVYEFHSVKAGVAIMRKTPATPGTPGMDVTGKVVKPKAGTDIRFAKPFKGVEVDPANENVLLAAIDGHPVFTRQGARVEPVMTVKAVDIHTGNIDYDGSLVVHKNIEAGYHVRVSGDVLVKGAVFRARVQSGGNIDIRGGVTGDDLSEDHNCVLQAEGDITAKFFQHVRIASRSDVHVLEYLMQCDVTAEGSINAGTSRGRGCIIGGHCLANVGVNAKVLGSEAYVPTMVQLGCDTDANRLLTALTQQLEKRTGEQTQLQQILDKIRRTGKPTNVGQTTLDKARKIEQTLLLLANKIEELSEQIEKLKPHAKLTDNLTVRVTAKLYPNVTVKINNLTWTSEKTQQRVQVGQENGSIICGPLKN